MTQQFLKFDFRKTHNLKDYIVDASNIQAVKWIDKYPNWKNHCLIIEGPKASGKSHLVRLWQKKSNCNILDSEDVNKELISVNDKNNIAIEGIEKIDKTIIIDQSPIGRTPRSNPATYTKVFDEIRKLFSQTTLSKERGYTPGHFSFNVKGGRCEACSGAGSIKLEMNFLPDVWITCDVCEGKRYTRECLEVTWKGKTIHDVLEMPIGEAVKFFENHKKIHRTLDTLRAVGLSYVRLGQPATTLSGGEAQRVKLASELRRPPNKHTVYILDEPTTGLALSDVQMLIDVLLELRGKGHTVIVIEHHLDVIKSSDWVIDLGPEGGDRGGQLIACGPPEKIAQNERSFTGQYLKDML